jgi:hypothetical protein
MLGVLVSRPLSFGCRCHDRPFPVRRCQRRGIESIVASIAALQVWRPGDCGDPGRNVAMERAGSTLSLELATRFSVCECFARRGR